MISRPNLFSKGRKLFVVKTKSDDFKWKYGKPIFYILWIRYVIARIGQPIHHFPELLKDT